MTSLVACPESEGLVAGPKLIHQLFRQPLSVLAQWYQELRDGDREEEEEDEIAVDVLPSNPAPPLKLHEGAESCHSSLRAGTASIVMSRNERGNLNFLNLPVSD